MHAIPRLRSVALCSTLLVVTPTACAKPASEELTSTPATAATAPEEGPPPGLGRRDDAATLGPYAEDGPVVLLAHRSAEYAGSVNSWLIEGPTEIGLVDAQMVVPEAEAVVALLRSRNKKLTWVWITHAHPDHYAGLAVVAEAFPEARLLARPATTKMAPTLRAKYDEPLQKFFPGLMAPAVELTPWEGEDLRVDGVEVRIVDFVGGEHELATALVIPELRAMLIADLVYNRVHPWLNELDVDTLLAHVKALEQLDGVDTFYPGHGEPFGKDYLPTFVKYVEDFLADAKLATDRQDLVARVWRRHRDWRTLAGLRFSATAHIGAREAAGSSGATTTP